MNVCSDGMGSWSYSIVQPLLERTFPKTQLTFDNSKKPDLVVSSHFTGLECLNFDCPYINWSGESYPVQITRNRDPLLELNTSIAGRANEIWFPHLVTELNHVVRPAPQPKKWCCVYANSNCVTEREKVFKRMRNQEQTCYALGYCSHTQDNPVELPQSERAKNTDVFKPFGFVVAMENKVAPKYLTEKIGYAFNAGAVPIYWGDSQTVSEFFNTDAFIDVSNFSSPEAAADFAVEVWRDKQKLQKYLDAPLTLNSNLADYEAVRSEYRPWQKPFIDILRDAFPDLS